ncbi:hypothetical protein BASA61_002368 [Batrachochytrium salamandrivorans]|nr:hypothetical protein BASA61_002368 [Batrachochytrium salamandrivorans]KAH9276033.1 hypothetical protein BASA83_001306 [Batrachochytrium salamandrivorans]
MKPFVLTFVAILATGTATLALPTRNYVDQSFLERRADDENPPARSPRVESLLPAGGKNRDSPARPPRVESLLLSADGKNRDPPTQRGEVSNPRNKPPVASKPLNLKPPTAPKPYKGKDQPKSGNDNSGSNADESTQKGLYSSAGSPRRGEKVAPKPKNTVSSSENLDDKFPLRPISRKDPGRGNIKKIRPKKDPSPPNDGEPVYAKINRQKKKPPRTKSTDEDELVYAEINHQKKPPPRRKSSDEDELVYQNVGHRKTNPPRRKPADEDNIYSELRH